MLSREKEAEKQKTKACRESFVVDWAVDVKW